MPRNLLRCPTGGTARRRWYPVPPRRRTLRGQELRPRKTSSLCVSCLSLSKSLANYEAKKLVPSERQKEENERDWHYGRRAIHERCGDELHKSEHHTERAYRL